MRRGLLVIASGTMMLLVGAASAGAEPGTTLVVDDVNPTLAGAAGADRTVTIGLTNLTSANLDVNVKPSDDKCQVGVNPRSLGPAQHKSVTITVPASCTVLDTGLVLSVSAAGAPSIPVTAKPAATASTSWAWLLVFPYLLGGLILFALGIYLWLRNMVRTKREALEQKAVEEPAAPTAHVIPKWMRKLWHNMSLPQLPYLDKAFSLKDSWAGNVTIIAGILTGVFGTGSVVKALLGKDADSTIALATVGAAISAALIAAGPIVGLSLKRDKTFTFIGLLLAGAVTLTGAAGQLIVVSVVASKIDFGGTHVPGLGWYVGIAGTILLAVYAVRSVFEIVLDGITPPKLVESDAVKAAKLVAHAMRATKPAEDRKFAPTLTDSPEYLSSSLSEDRPRRAVTF